MHSAFDVIYITKDRVHSVMTRFSYSWSANGFLILFSLVTEIWRHFSCSIDQPLYPWSCLDKQRTRDESKLLSSSTI